MGVITDGVFVGGLHALAAWALWKKLPAKMREFLKGHPLLTESGVAVATYGTSGGGITALASAAAATLFAVGGIHVATHPDDFVWLDDLAERGGKSARALADWLKKENAAYVERKRLEGAQG